MSCFRNVCACLLCHEWRRTQAKRGAYWLSPAGRDELRDTFGYDDNDHSCVPVLLNALEAAEAKLIKEQTA